MWAALQGVFFVIGLIPRLFGMLTGWFHDRGVRHAALKEVDQASQLQAAKVETTVAKIGTETEQQVADEHKKTRAERVADLRARMRRPRL